MSYVSEHRSTTVQMHGATYKCNLNAARIDTIAPTCAPSTGQNHTFWLFEYSWRCEVDWQTKVFPLGTAKWVGLASHGQMKAKMGLAFKPNTARADVWMAASTVDRTAVQRSCSSATLHFA